MSGTTKFGTGSLNTSTGANNSAFGNYAAYHNGDASCNTAVGSNALFNNTNAPHNTAIGAGSMFYNTTGQLNTAVGSSALEGSGTAAASVGNQNVAIGAQALYDNSGNQNVGVGCYALLNNTIGGANTAVGYDAGHDLSGNSSFNTFLGYNADISSNTLVYSNSTALGYSATIDASNQIVLGGNASGSYPSVKIPGSYVGINGVYAPSSNYNLDVSGNINFTGNLYQNGIIYDASGGSSQWSNGTSNSIYYNTGSVGIGTNTPSYALDISGNLNTNADAFIHGLTVGQGTGNILTNTAVGAQALYSKVSGAGNTAIGAYTLINSISGINNTAVGSNALTLNESDSFNTAVGYYTLKNHKNGERNTALGALAGSSDISGNYNTFLGSDSDVSNNSYIPNGVYSNSTALGFNAIIDDSNQIVLGGQTPFGSYYPSVYIPGSYVGIGGLYNPVSSGYALDVSGNINFTGNLYQQGVIYPAASGTNYWTTDGTDISNNNTGSVGIGTTPNSIYALDVSGILHTNADALINTLTVGLGGGNLGTNTAIGYQALQNNTTGNSNTAFGYTALLENTTGIQNTALGLNALQNNTSGIRNTVIGYSALSSNTIGQQNTVIGYSALGLNTIGVDNTALGSNAGVNLSGNSNLNTFLGSGTNVSLSLSTYTNSTALGYSAIIDASNCIVLGNSAILTLTCAVQTITGLSDARDKKDIQPLTNGINFIEKLNPVSFIWDTRDKAKVDIPEMGFIAQELKQVQEETGITVPNLVSDKNPDRIEASYGTLLPILVKAVQELSAKVTTLETELNELKK